jgi:hypothetical protein
MKKVLKDLKGEVPSEAERGRRAVDPFRGFLLSSHRYFVVITIVSTVFAFALLWSLFILYRSLLL